MEIVQEIDVTEDQHKAIEELRNHAFSENQVNRSYFKQLPHMRAVHFDNEQLIGYLGLDYRVIKVGEEVFKVLGVIDFCIHKEHRGKGIGSSMLSEVALFAESRDVDFIILISELDSFYIPQGYQRVESLQSWLRIHEHTNYGVAVDFVDELFIKPISGKQWGAGPVDWLGYMF